VAAAGFAFAMLASVAMPAKAVEANQGIGQLSALRSYVQLIGTTSSEAAGTTKSAQGEIAALRSFAQQIDPKAPLKGDIKLADADSLLGALQQAGKPAAPPAKMPAYEKKHHHAPLAAAKYVGNKVCLGCHTSQANEFNHTLMGRIEMQGKLTCETCHGPGSEHVRLGGGRGVGGIISFRPNDLSRSAADDNAICLGCHERGDRTNWHGSIHQTRGLYCTNCHTIMKRVSRKNQLKTAWQPDTCFQCHKDRRAQIFRSSHMPMRPDEGKVVCSDCHNPHGSFTEALLRGDSINEVCYKCHAEKRGPFLFEHEPVRENCTNCHNPHGSVNEYSLKLSRPRLCFECHGFGHGQTNGPGAIFTMGRQCQNCHTAIHGSNSPSGVYLQR
jgi:DmsE family decaheme c-type cytochrome